MPSLQELPNSTVPFSIPLTPCSPTPVQPSMPAAELPAYAGNAFKWCARARAHRRTSTSTSARGRNRCRRCRSCPTEPFLSSPLTPSSPTPVQPSMPPAELPLAELELCSCSAVIAVFSHSGWADYVVLRISLQTFSMCCILLGAASKCPG